MGARVGFFRIPLTRYDCDSERNAARRALEEKNMNERLGASGHDCLRCLQAYKGALVRPIRQSWNLGAGKALGKIRLAFVYLT